MTTTPERTATLTSLVAAEIRATMGRLDVRQSELARRMGETDQWMSMRLKGRTPIDINELSRIAKALEVGVHDLLPPPDAAARAADPKAMARYIPLPVWTTDRGRAPNNRPSGPSGSTRPGLGRRTARVPRGRRPSAD
jgi:transcriptional regulator with XRE-family HTH domain